MSQALFTPLKLHRSYADQLQQLKLRGLVVADEQNALDTLKRLNYYRLSGYWYPFRKTNPIGTPGRQDDFQANTSFEISVNLYEFDRQLRMLVLDAIERIEVAIRVDISHRLGKKHRLAHECPRLLDGKFVNNVSAKTGLTGYQEWCNKLNEVVARAKDDFVKHHKANYFGKMPIWVSVELWELGLLSKFFAGMQHGDQSYVAKKYGLSQGNYLASWLRTITFARNVSAHHGRLWNRNVPERPTFPPSQPHHRLYHVATSVPAQTRVYGALAVIQQMLRVIAPQDNWATRLKALCSTFPVSSVVSLNDAGFPVGWENMALWN